jgi:hypothetical protein
MATDELRGVDGPIAVTNLRGSLEEAIERVRDVYCKRSLLDSRDEQDARVLGVLLAVAKDLLRRLNDDERERNRAADLRARLAAAEERERVLTARATAVANALSEVGHDYMSMSHYDRCGTCQRLMDTLAAGKGGG